jgi:hypothetical protein
MFDQIELGSEFFEKLTAIDEAIVKSVAAQRCEQCGGPLHRGDYPRKPRGGLADAALAAFTRRFSLCCGREGCRRRATPPSVRFLGRRVYLGAIIIAASIIAIAAATAGAIRRATGIAPRTTRRWLRWWRESFPATSVFVVIASRFIEVSRRRLPSSILERLTGTTDVRVSILLGWLAPLTTASVADGARFLRGAV